MATKHMAARLTVGIDGSFGVLRYALLALSPPSASADRGLGGKEQDGSFTGGLVRRGFRRACNSDYADIALKAQPADGTVLCRASTSGLVSLWFEENLVWSERFNPEDKEAVLWLAAAKARDVAVISGDNVLISGARVDLTVAAAQGTLVMARIPTVWT